MLGSDKLRRERRERENESVKARKRWKWTEGKDFSLDSRGEKEEGVSMVCFSCPKGNRVMRRKRFQSGTFFSKRFILVPFNDVVF